MKKLMLIGVLFVLCAGWVLAATQTLIDDPETAADLTGTCVTDATIYANFQMLGCAFTITPFDMWNVTGILPSDDLVQGLGGELPYTIQNTGGISIDMGFWLSDEDDIDIWTHTEGAWGAPAVIDQYVLGLIITATSVSPGDVTTGDYGVEDILGEAAMEYYLAAGRFQTGVPLEVYTHEGGTGLNLWAGPAGADDTVEAWFRFVMSSAGSSDDLEHKATITVGAQVTAG